MHSSSILNVLLLLWGLSLAQSCTNDLPSIGTYLETDIYFRCDSSNCYFIMNLQYSTRWLNPLYSFNVRFNLFI